MASHPLLSSNIQPIQTSRNWIKALQTAATDIEIESRPMRRCSFPYSPLVLAILIVVVLLKPLYSSHLTGDATGLNRGYTRSSEPAD